MPRDWECQPSRILRRAERPPIARVPQTLDRLSEPDGAELSCSWLLRKTGRYDVKVQEEARTQHALQDGLNSNGEEG